VVINFTLNALEDIENIGAYHSQYSKIQTKRLIKGFFDSVQLLEKFPFLVEF
jgi:plasmid stabilization system protein ParE